uniref:Nuclear pore complex protein Nup85 n=1 Tax=Angiostrongylus cantonensis TaxID=6313 RepID=A0A158PBP1_ANGCA
MHVIFEKCQQLSRHVRLNNVETLSISREYRSALLHCAEEIEEEENMSKLDRWKHELNSLLTSGAFDSNKNVLFLAQLLHGDRKYLERAASAVVSEWWHLMPFYVFVKNFTVAYNELGTLAHECRDLFKTVENCKDEEFDPFLSILTMKDISVLQGRLRLESHIEAMHIEDEAMAEALMRICEEQDLDDSKACIVNTMTYRYLREEEWSSALSWAMRGGRGHSLDIAVNRIVWQAKKDTLATLSALDHMADYVAELGSHSLAFLFNYYRFHRSLSAGDMRSGVPLLVSMIISPNVPQSFHKVLFGYLMLLLSDTPQIQIPQENIHKLVAFFRQYTIDNATNSDTLDDTIRSLEPLLLMQLSEGEMISAATKNLKLAHTS